MAFGQAAGPPASARDVTRLAELVEQAGFSSFKEARHPLGLNQRQAAGRFTRDEASELIERLEAESEGGDGPPDASAAAPAPSARPRSSAATAGSPRASRRRPTPVAGLGDDELVAELELRGWTCIPPVRADLPDA